MALDKSLTILCVVLMALFGGVLLFEVTNIIASDIERLYHLAERANLDYEKTLQETSDYIQEVVAREMGGVDYVYMNEVHAEKEAVKIIEQARKSKIDMEWVESFRRISLVVKKLGIYINLLCIPALIIKDFRDAQAKTFTRCKDAT